MKSQNYLTKKQLIMSTSTHTAPDTKTAAKKKVNIHWTATLFIIVIFLSLFYMIFKGAENPEMKHLKKDGGELAKSSPQKIVKTIHVKFGKDYSEGISLPYRCWVNFLNSTTAYCIKNEAGTEKCAEKGHNLSLGDLDENSYLQFKTRDGDVSGEIDIELTEK